METEKKIINLIIAFLSLILAALLYIQRGWKIAGVWIVIAIVFALVHIVLALIGERVEEYKSMQGSSVKQILPGTALTEIVLLGEENNRLASWNIYGKNGLVIGRDVGENHVSINLENSTYASMIDIEHAVLNYSGDCWYIEDVSEKNGVSIQKYDGRKYKLAYGKPCRLEKGDIIYIALTRLQIL